MTRDANGKVVVIPNSVGRLEYATNGVAHGSCYLSCHGRDHNPRAY
jgi:hypothetical protein